MKTTWRTSWQQHDIVVYRDEVEVDRVAADRIGRVFLLYRGRGDSPGDIARSVVETRDGEALLLAAATGFAGRVNFERAAFWRSRDCVYWVDAARASLPWRLRLARRLSGGVAWQRCDWQTIAAAIARWPLEGPETWEQRKQHRIERSRPFGSSRPDRAAA